MHIFPLLSKSMFGVVVLVVAAVGALSTHPLWTHAGSPGAQEDKPATSGDESVKTLSMNCYISSVTIFFIWYKIWSKLKNYKHKYLFIFFISSI
jgi:hypothetical protein